MKFPLPSPGTVKFTIYRCPIEGVSSTASRIDMFYDSGLCHGCGRKHERTARIEGFPSLCRDCYQNVYEYSTHYDDPLKLKKLKKGESINDELTREVISMGKKMDRTSSMMAVGIAYDFVYGSKSKELEESVEVTDIYDHPISTHHTAEIEVAPETEIERVARTKRETSSKSKTKRGFRSWPLWLKILTIILLMNPVGVVVLYVILVRFFWNVFQLMRKDTPIRFWFLFIILLYPPCTLTLGFFIGIGMLVQIIFG